MEKNPFEKIELNFNYILIYYAQIFVYKNTYAHEK